MKAGRKHSRFPRISANPLHHLKRKKLKAWIKQKHAKQALIMKITLTPTSTTEDSENSDSEEIALHSEQGVLDSEGGVSDSEGGVSGSEESDAED